MEIMSKSMYVSEHFYNMNLMSLKELSGLSKIDSELARYRGLLEKKYRNDHDLGYTYIDPHTLDSVALTPFMMKEWARALVSQKQSSQT